MVTTPDKFENKVSKNLFLISLVTDATITKEASSPINKGKPSPCVSSASSDL
tara:strand:+ start:1531 stop:1686 length:156 start_codon:yes stop_codon:yes gene_type:complete